MPRLPKEVLETVSRSISNVNEKIKKYTLKDNFLIYSFVLIVAVELSSIFLVNLKSYLLFIYPLLTQLVMFILTLTLALYSRRLRFCIRKELVLYIVSSYYLFNMISVIFPISNYMYSVIINLLIMGTATYLLITEIGKK